MSREAVSHKQNLGKCLTEKACRYFHLSFSFDLLFLCNRSSEGKKKKKNPLYSHWYSLNLDKIKIILKNSTPSEIKRKKMMLIKAQKNCKIFLMAKFSKFAVHGNTYQVGCMYVPEIH